MPSGQSGRRSVPTTRMRTLTSVRGQAWPWARAGCHYYAIRTSARSEIRLRQAALGGISLTLTAFLDRTVAATASLHITDERGRPPCGPAHRAGEFEGDLGSARAPPKRVDFGREQVPRQNGLNDLCTYAGPCTIRLVTGLDHVGGLWCGPYRVRTRVHLRRRVELAALWRARAPHRTAPPTRDPKPSHR